VEGPKKQHLRRYRHVLPAPPVCEVRHESPNASALLLFNFDRPFLGRREPRNADIFSRAATTCPSPEFSISCASPLTWADLGGRRGGLQRFSQKGSIARCTIRTARQGRRSSNATPRPAGARRHAAVALRPIIVPFARNHRLVGWPNSGPAWLASCWMKGPRVSGPEQSASPCDGRTPRLLIIIVILTSGSLGKSNAWFGSCLLWLAARPKERWEIALSGDELALPQSLLCGHCPAGSPVTNLV
jgi:hypothetical protein